MKLASLNYILKNIDKYIMNEITLEYMMNPNLYDKYVEQTQSEKNATFNLDKVKYKNRIIHTTKLLFEGRSKNDSLNKAFDNFIHECISSYKTKEIQKQGLPEHAPMNTDIQFNCQQQEHNKTIKMDKFVKKTSINKTQMPRIQNLNKV